MTPTSLWSCPGFSSGGAAPALGAVTTVANSEITRRTTASPRRMWPAFRDSLPTLYVGASQIGRPIFRREPRQFRPVVHPWYTKRQIALFLGRNGHELGILVPLIGVRIPTPELINYRECLRFDSEIGVVSRPVSTA